MFVEKLRAAQDKNHTFLCVGLDPDPELMPHPDVAFFLTEIIEATKDLVCAYKPNLAFFEALGPGGMQTLMESLRAVPASIPVIADAKRGDIGNTARFYAKALFDVYDFDAATVNGYGGRDAVQPFADYAERGVLIWCRSSNPGAADVQDVRTAEGGMLYEKVAESARAWNEHGNVGLVAGATWPEQIERVREICPDQLILVPGVGAQEGELEAAVQAAADARGEGFLIAASRAVVYASRAGDYAGNARRAAQGLRTRINTMREALLAGR
ncbi:MAG: orotidine-5'-phosphate decarboxylase [Dehalococcoidia bacterium]